MDRRDFIKGLALIASGAAAMPEQIAAFEHLYDVNSPKTDLLIAVDEIYLTGMATTSTRVAFDIFKGNEFIFPFGFNAFGGALRWVAGPDQKVTASNLTWKLSSPDNSEVIKVLRGHISYLDQGMVRRYHQITTPNGTIGDAAFT